LMPVVTANLLAMRENSPCYRRKARCNFPFAAVKGVRGPNRTANPPCFQRLAIFLFIDGRVIFCFWTSDTPSNLKKELPDRIIFV
jgi:hypothetical protein